METNVWGLKEMFPGLAETLIEEVLRDAKRDGLNQDALMDKLLTLQTEQEKKIQNMSNEEREKQLLEDRKNKLEMLKNLFDGADEKKLWSALEANQWDVESTVEAMLNPDQPPATPKRKGSDEDEWVMIDSVSNKQDPDQLFQSVIWTDPKAFLNDTSSTAISMEEIPTDLYDELENEREKEVGKAVPSTEDLFYSTGMDLQSSQMSATLFTRPAHTQKKEEEPIASPFIQQSLKSLVTQLQKDVPKLVADMHVITPTLTPERAEAIFREWRQSLWFAPTGFSQIITRPKIKLAYVPYYCVAPTTQSFFKAKFEKEPSNWEEFSSTREAADEKYVAFGSVGWQQATGELLDKIRDWDMEVSRPVLDMNNITVENVKNAVRVEVRKLAEPGAVWPVVEKDIVNKEKEVAQKKLMDDYAKQTKMIVKMKEFVLDKIIYKETRYRVVYVPIYIMKYFADLEYLAEEASDGKQQQQAKRKSKSPRYTFIVNAQSGKHDGIRPYGMGKVLGTGMRFLEGIFGVRDQESVAFVNGKYLSAVDACPHYETEGQYLLFPPSHSYILYSDVGFITLKNTSERRALWLFSQKRRTDKIGGKYLLQPGATATFDFKGDWCIRIEEVPGEKEAAGPFVPDACLSVLEVSADGGGSYGNLLGMMM